MTTIDINEIRNVYKEFNRDKKEPFSENKFQEFLHFLEIDFYDLIKGNIRQFNQKK